MVEAGTSPSFVLFCGRGSAGLGRGEIRSTSAVGGSFRTTLDLKMEQIGVSISWSINKQTSQKMFKT